MTLLPLKRFPGAWLVVAVSLLLSACSDEESSGFEREVNLATPDNFLLFFNQQAKLPPGHYRVIAATAAAGESGTFSIQVTRNDGSATQLLNGTWSNSAGPGATLAATCPGSTNVCFDIDMAKSSGVKIELSSSLDSILYLFDDSDTPQLVAQANAATAGQKEVINFSKSGIDATSYASAYYAAVDPANARDTLQKYRTLHGFDSSSDVVHVIFRDSKDLGYGRDMYMHSYPNTECGGQVIAFYVQNFQVEIVDGHAYGPVNLAAALQQDLQHHFGSNAIEFSRGLTSAGDTCSPEPFTRFFTYRSDYSSKNADHPRILSVNLDGRGNKAMPQPCITCHGGKLFPMDRFGRFAALHANDAVAQIGDTKSHLQAFEVDSFEFAPRPGQTRADNEEGLRKLNSAVFCSYPGSAGHPACDDFGGGLTTQTDNGEWNGDFAREVLLGWYGNQLETVGAAYSEEFTPSGWAPAAGGPPVGADTLFKKVIAPNCFVCHGKRGSALGSNRNESGTGMDIDFSSWDKFISHAEEIRQLVFEQGRMPLGLLNYSNFWGDPEKAELLASFIAPYVDVDFAAHHLDEQQNIILPGKTVAYAGLDRITKPNAAVTLDARSSLFADQFEWSLVSAPSSAVVTFSAPEMSQTLFSADVEGSYVVQLLARSSLNGNQSSSQLAVQVDATLSRAPKALTFYDDVLPVLADCATSCHSAGGGSEVVDGINIAAGVPVWWVDDTGQPLGIPASELDLPSLGLYEQVRARINFDRLLDSPIIKKPSNVHHFGGLRPGFSIDQEVGSSNRVSYDLLVNWISEGAVCGGTAEQCPNDEL